MTTLPPMTLEPELTAKLKRAATKMQTWQDERDRLICEAMDAGASSREVAELVGLSHAGVIKIHRRHGENAP